MAAISGNFPTVRSSTLGNNAGYSTTASASVEIVFGFAVRNDRLHLLPFRKDAGLLIATIAGAWAIGCAAPFDFIISFAA